MALRQIAQWANNEVLHHPGTDLLIHKKSGAGGPMTRIVLDLPQLVENAMDWASDEVLCAALDLIQESRASVADSRPAAEAPASDQKRAPRRRSPKAGQDPPGGRKGD